MMKCRVGNELKQKGMSGCRDDFGRRPHELARAVGPYCADARARGRHLSRVPGQCRAPLIDGNRLRAQWDRFQYVPARQFCP